MKCVCVRFPWGVETHLSKEERESSFFALWFGFVNFIENKIYRLTGNLVQGIEFLKKIFALDL